MSKWYDVPEDQEQAAILKKREEWFPKADKTDWAILNEFFHLIDLKKRTNQILMKDAVNYFPSRGSGAVNKFCNKFHSSVIVLSSDKNHLDIGSIGYRILVDENFKDLRETRFWFPHLDQILIENQDEGKTQTEFTERELHHLLSEIESSRELERQRKFGNINRPYTVRTPNIESFIVSEIADYNPSQNSDPLINLRRNWIIGVDPQDWYDNFFINHFSHLDGQKTTGLLAKEEPKSSKTNKRIKIFVSCGQYRESEKTIGKKLTELIDELTPYEGYFAQNQVSLNGLSENIFKELNDCAGIVVVMHARGNIETPDGDVIRASVWIEQEIAIAAFIQKIQKREIKIILYAEDGISLEGVRSQLHLNPVVFKNESEIEEHFKKYLSFTNFGSISVEANAVFECSECDKKFNSNEDLVHHQTVQNHFDWTKDLD